MVFSYGKGLRYCVQAAAVCVIALSVIPTVLAQTSDADSGSESGGDKLSTSCGISNGDKAFGIQVVTDVACATGGLGCYNDHCRYCKVTDTLKSAHLESCESLGASFPSMAPLTVSTGACHVSRGDAAVGVGGMTDASCLYGGIGCFNDHCRFCQSKTTPESSQFVSCSWVEDASSSSGSIGGSAGDAGLGRRLATKSVEATVAGTSTVCSMAASDGDIAIGINIITDATCANGGSGCIDSICRFCKTKDTTQSAHFTACPVATKTCTTTVSDGDAAVGINIITDASCAQGGLGCIDSVCRFCRQKSTSQSSSFVDCALIGTTPTQTSVTTTAPVVATPAATPVPTPTPATAVKQMCSQTVSDGDAAVGIKIVTDTSCSSGGLGCIDQICRFCRVTTTAQSSSFVDCTTIVGTSTTSAPATAAPTITPAPTTAAPTKTPTSITATSTKTPTTSTATTAPSTAVCTITAAAGDIAAGINIATDRSCVSGGLGCIDSVCRFCRVAAKTQSSPYVDCAAITGTTTQNSTPAPTPAPTPTTKVSTPSVVFDCYRTISSGDKAVGLDIASDIRCSEGGAGCLDEVCRYCKRFDTVQSHSYIDCSTIPSSDIGSDITFMPIPAVDDFDTPERMLADDLFSSIDDSFNADATNSSDDNYEGGAACTMTVSPGDAAVGINIVTDTSCSSGGTGCIDTICRYCKTKDTDQSAHFSSCPFTTTASTSTAKTCMTTVSDGDASVGINIITDTSCANGGLGCIDSICRYCKTKSTDQSAHFGSCSDYSSTTSSPAASAPVTATAPPTTVAPVTTAPTSTYSIPLDCYQTVSGGDKSLGLDVVTDMRCGDGGVGCLDSICRLCKRFETAQSHSYMNCSDIPASDAGADINFKVIVTDDTLESTSAETIVVLHKSENFPSEVADDICANVSLADGQAAGGIGVVLDTVHCPEGLASGCIGSEGCRYCMRFPTNVSDYLEYCTIANSTSVAYALSGLSPSIEDGSTRSDEPGRTRSLYAEAGSISVETQASDAGASKFVMSETIQWIAVAAVCVGAVIIVALAVFGLNRTIKNLAARNTRSSGKEKVNPDEGNRPSVLVASNIGEPGIISDV